MLPMPSPPCICTHIPSMSIDLNQSSVCRDLKNENFTMMIRWWYLMAARSHTSTSMLASAQNKYFTHCTVAVDLYESKRSMWKSEAKRSSWHVLLAWRWSRCFPNYSNWSQLICLCVCITCFWPPNPNPIAKPSDKIPNDEASGVGALMV